MPIIKDSAKAFYVYMIINLITWKLYIGCTSEKDPHQRWRNHISMAKSCIKNYPITRAIAKYGADNFEFKVIKECASFEEMLAQEIMFIAYYDTCNNNWGYNLTRGGEGTLGWNPSEEWRKNTSERGKLLVGDKNPFWGKTHSDATKKIVSESTKRAFKAGAHDKRIENLKVITDEQTEKLREEYLLGELSIKELMRKYAISKGAFYVRIKDITVGRNKKGGTRRPSDRPIKKTYRAVSKDQYKEIAKIFGIRPELVAHYVRRYKKENNIPLNNRGRQWQKHEKTYSVVFTDDELLDDPSS